MRVPLTVLAATAVAAAVRSRRTARRRNAPARLVTALADPPGWERLCVGFPAQGGHGHGRASAVVRWVSPVSPGQSLGPANALLTDAGGRAHDARLTPQGDGYELHGELPDGCVAVATIEPGAVAGTTAVALKVYGSGRRRR